MRKNSRPLASVLAALALLAPWAGPAAASAPVGIVDREIAFSTAEGVDIRGILNIPEDAFEAGRAVPVAVLLHGFGRDRDSLGPMADTLVARGIAAAVIDLRGHGRSRRMNRSELYVFPVRPIEEFAFSVADVDLLVEALGDNASLDLDRLAVLGVAEGALIAADAAARIPQARAVVMVDPPATAGGFEPRRSLSVIGSRPVLLVGSAHEASRTIVESLVEYGVGPRETVVIDVFESRDRLLGAGSPGALAVADWLAERLDARSP